MPSYIIGEFAITVGRRSRNDHYCKRDGDITTIISKLFQSFVLIIIIIAKKFAPKLQYFEIFCNNDDYCNERKKSFDIMLFVPFQISTISGPGTFVGPDRPTYYWCFIKWIWNLFIKIIKMTERFWSLNLFLAIEFRDCQRWVFFL